MRSIFNIPRRTLVHYFKTNISYQRSRLRYLFPKKMKSSEIMDKSYVESNGEFLQEQRFLFKPSATEQKVHGSFSCSKYLAQDVHGRLGKHRIGLTFYCSMFSTEIKKINNMNTKRSMSTGGDFADLFSQDNVFVDKSLFIKEVFEDKSKVLLITMPRRWGKSLNLDMLRRFLSIEEIDKKEKQINKKIFYGEKNILLNITKIQILKKQALEFQGKYPVIFLDFQNCKGKTQKEVEESLKKTIIKTFYDFGYLNRSQKDYCGLMTIGQRYDKLLSQIQSGDYKTVLQELTKLLYYYHGQKVWILIDEYDAAANEAYLTLNSQDSQAISLLFRNVLQLTLKSNKYLEKCVMTGVQYILKSGMLSGLNNVQMHNVTSSKYSKYYGINKYEMDKLLIDLGIEDEAKKLEIKKWYNGYKQNRGTSQEPNFIDKYNIWSVAKYLNNQGDGFKSYWENNTLAQQIQTKILRNTSIKNNVLDLINGKGLKLSKFVTDFTTHDFQALKQIIDRPQQINISIDGVDLFFSYLFITGYLTFTPQDNQFVLPNKEIKYCFENLLTKYYWEILRIEPKEMIIMTQKLDLVFYEKTKEKILSILKQDFAPKFSEFLLKLDLGVKKQLSPHGLVGNEDLIHSFLNYIAIQIPNAKFGTQCFTKKPDEKDGRADIWLFKNGISTIIEVKYNKKIKNSKQGQIQAKKALKQAKNYIKLSEDSHTKIFISCVVTPKKEVYYAFDVLN